jgi:hypothetical protein
LEIIKGVEKIPTKKQIDIARYLGLHHPQLTPLLQMKSKSGTNRQVWKVMQEKTDRKGICFS